MKSAIVTIFPRPSERYLDVQPALPGGTATRRVEALPSKTSSVDALPSIESVILQKLLAEMEARQLAPTQPTYVIDQPRGNRRLVPTLWALLWATSIALSVLGVKYFDMQTMIPRTDDGPSQSIDKLTATVSSQNQVTSRILDSLQQLVGAVGSSVHHTATIEDALSRLGNRLPHNRVPPVEGTPEAAFQAPVPVIIGTQKADSAPIPMGGHVHPPLDFAVAPYNATVHHDSRGIMDYWLLPRTASGVTTLVKVVPVLQNNSGTLVHDVAEVKDYLVTASGDWVEQRDSAGVR